SAACPYTTLFRSEHLAASLRVRVRGGFGRGLVHGVQRGVVVAGRPAAGGEGRVDGDAMQPRADLGLAPEPGQPAPGPEERLLDHVGGELGVGHETHGDAVDAAAMLVDELVELWNGLGHRATSKRPVTVVTSPSRRRRSKVSPPMSPSTMAPLAGRSGAV